MKMWLMFRYNVEMLYVFGNECNRAKNINPTIWDTDSMLAYINQFLSTLGLRSIRSHIRHVPMLIFISLFKNLSMERSRFKSYLDVYSLSKRIVEKRIENPSPSDIVGLLYFTYANFWRLRCYKGA